MLAFNKDELNELMKNFYTLLKIKIVIFDNDFNKIHSMPEDDCAFCSEIKKSIQGKKNCIISDHTACDVCKKTGQLYVYKCHCGLIEAVFPLKFNDLNLGYIMFGQLIDKSDKKTKKSEVLEYAAKFTDKDLDISFDKITSKTVDQIEAAGKIMEACACYLWVNRLVYSNENSIVLNITNYINENLQTDLSANTLCKIFNISRSQLYDISNYYYGCGVASFVRQKRVEKARTLLENGSTVSEAAYLAGFYDYNYFSKIFKKSTGVLPSEIKKSAKTK